MIYVNKNLRFDIISSRGLKKKAKMSSCEHIEQKLKSSSDLGDLTHLVRPIIVLVL